MDSAPRFRYLDFSGESRFWDEIMQLIEAVRDDTTTDEASVFHRGTFSLMLEGTGAQISRFLAIFQNLLPELQQTILLELAEKQKEKVDQCRYLLLLLRLCPDSASTFGVNGA